MYSQPIFKLRGLSDQQYNTQRDIAIQERNAVNPHTCETEAGECLLFHVT